MTDVALASARRRERLMDAEIDKRIDLLFANLAENPSDHYHAVTANPRTMGYLRFLLKHYAAKPHPWRSCFPADTPVDCPRDHARYPDGVPISQLKEGDLVWSFNVDAYLFELRPVTWANITRRKAQLAMLTLDDGAQIKATPDHQFMRRDTTWVELQDLRSGDSLMPLYRDYIPMIRRNPESLSWAPEHIVVANTQWPDRDRKLHVHHRDARRSNTAPSNFSLLSSTEHAREHHKTVRELLVANGVVRCCNGCGARFQPVKRNQKLCGECPPSFGYVRKVVGKPRKCHHCGIEFVVRQPNQVFCCADCREMSYQKGRFCRECGVDLRSVGRSRVWCDEHRPRAETKEPMSELRMCRNCGMEFKPCSGVQRHCSAECRKRYQQRNWSQKPEASPTFNHKVVSVVLLDERQDVWDIEVAENHSFVVRGVVVHNCFRDNFKRFGPKTAGLCGVLKDTIRQQASWRGHPEADVGAPGVAIAEADKGAAPAWGGHHKLSEERCLSLLDELDLTFGVVDHEEPLRAAADALVALGESCDVYRVLIGLDEPPREIGVAA